MSQEKYCAGMMKRDLALSNLSKEERKYLFILVLLGRSYGVHWSAMR